MYELYPIHRSRGLYGDNNYYPKPLSSNLFRVCLLNLTNKKNFEGFRSATKKLKIINFCICTYHIVKSYYKLFILQFQFWLFCDNCDIIYKTVSLCGDHWTDQVITNIWDMQRPFHNNGTYGVKVLKLVIVYKMLLLGY